MIAAATTHVTATAAVAPTAAAVTATATPMPEDNDGSKCHEADCGEADQQSATRAKLIGIS